MKAFPRLCYSSLFTFPLLPAVGGRRGKRSGTADDGGRAWGKSIAGQAISIVNRQGGLCPQPANCP